MRGLVFPQSRPTLSHTIFYPNQARGFEMRKSNGHEIINMNKFITNAYITGIRTYMVLLIKHVSPGIQPLPNFFFFFHHNFFLQTSEFYVDICSLDLFPYLKGFKELVLQLEYNI